MANEAAINFGRSKKYLFSGPYLEIGSKIQPSYTQFSPRDIHDPADAQDWIGIDIEEGEGVDKVVDLSIPGIVKELGWTGRFGTVHCLNVLAHVPNIFHMANNIQDCLRDGGKLFVSVPFAWKIHRIPLDMWRFTPQSVDFLFPLIEFQIENCGVCTRHPTRRYDVYNFPELPLGSGLKKLGSIFSLFIRILRKTGLDHGYFDQRALLVESILMMIGEKKSHVSYTFFPYSYQQQREPNKCQS